MPNSSPRGRSLHVLLDRFLDAVVAEVTTRVGSRGGGRGRGGPGRKLDMRCRVSGCKNMTRGPRFGFICDDHRKSLSKKQQQQARDTWNAKLKQKS